MSVSVIKSITSKVCRVHRDFPLVAKGIWHSSSFLPGMEESTPLEQHSGAPDLSVLQQGLQPLQGYSLPHCWFQMGPTVYNTNIRVQE
eukprot:m.47088 g.47088  ORF g.47088 m.47088 type:complete len:88 (-) comp10742_c1_seq8:1615-1878(-)